jgi:hypothetical protein
MFNWQQDASLGPVVSPRFWVYWVVTIPLCLVTLGGWAIWWGYEKRRYDVDVAETLLSADTLDRPSWFNRLSRKDAQRSMKEEGHGVRVDAHKAQVMRQRSPWSNRYSTRPQTSEVMLEQGRTLE